MSTYKVSLSENNIEEMKIVNSKNEETNTFKSGENFKIIMPLQNISEDRNFRILVEGDVETKPVFYGESGDSNLQNYALTGAVYENGTGQMKVNYTKNETKIKILKQTLEEKTPLEGVTFQILDKDQNVIYSDLVTDAKGEITVENLLPGTYYIKEVKTLEGYTVYDKLIKAELELNETLSAIVNNAKEEIIVEQENPETIIEVESSETIIEVEKPEVSVKIEEAEKIEKVEKTTEKVTVKLPKTGM